MANLLATSTPSITGTTCLQTPIVKTSCVVNEGGTAVMRFASGFAQACICLSSPIVCGTACVQTGVLHSNVICSGNIIDIRTTGSKAFRIYGSGSTSTYTTTFSQGSSGGHDVYIPTGCFCAPILCGTSCVQAPRIKAVTGSNQLGIGQWDGSNHRIEGDANLPLLLTSYQGNINMGISGTTHLKLTSSCLCSANIICANTCVKSAMLCSTAIGKADTCLYSPVICAGTRVNTTYVCINEQAEVRPFTTDGLRGIQLRSGCTTTVGGIEVTNNAGTWLSTFYVSGANYGHLDASWGNWDIKKTVNGSMCIWTGSSGFFCNMEGAVFAATCHQAPVVCGTTCVKSPVLKLDCCMYFNVHNGQLSQHATHLFHFCSNHSTVSAIRLTSNSQVEGYVYGDTRHIGFLDAGGSWSYFSHCGNCHDWRISNTRYALLTANCFCSGNVICANVCVQSPIICSSGTVCAPSLVLTSDLSGDMKNGIALGCTGGLPQAAWGESGTKTGRIEIGLPTLNGEGQSNHHGMVHVAVDVYEYNGNDVMTFIVGGHNWQCRWYNCGAHITGGCTDKTIKVAYHTCGGSGCNGRYVILLGEPGSTWSYGSVHVRSITNGLYYSNAMNMCTPWYVKRVTCADSYYNQTSPDLRSSSKSMAGYQCALTCSSTAIGCATTCLKSANVCATTMICSAACVLAAGCIHGASLIATSVASVHTGGASCCGLAVGQTFSNEGGWHNQINSYGTNHNILRIKKNAGSTADNAQCLSFWVHDGHAATIQSTGNLLLKAGSAMSMCLKSGLACTPILCAPTCMKSTCICASSNMLFEGTLYAVGGAGGHWDTNRLCAATCVVTPVVYPASCLMFDQSGTRSWKICAGSGRLDILSGDDAGKVYFQDRVVVNGTDDNSGKSDFTVHTGGTAAMALSGGAFKVGAADVNWSVAVRANGAFETYGQNLTIGTSSSGNIYLNPVGGVNCAYGCLSSPILCATSCLHTAKVCASGDGSYFRQTTFFPGVVNYRALQVCKWTTGWNGASGEALWGLEWAYTVGNARRAQLFYDHNSTEEFVMQSNYGSIVFNASQNGNLNPNQATERMRIHSVNNCVVTAGAHIACTCVHSPTLCSTTRVRIGNVDLTNSNDTRLKICGSGDNYMIYGPANDNGWGYIQSVNNANGLYLETSQGRFAFDTGHLSSYNDGEVDVGVTNNRFRCANFSCNIYGKYLHSDTYVYAGSCVCSAILCATGSMKAPTVCGTGCLASHIIRSGANNMCLCPSGCGYGIFFGPSDIGEKQHWTTGVFTASSAQARRAKILEFSYNTHHWDSGGAIIIETFLNYFGKGSSQKWQIIQTGVDGTAGGSQNCSAGADLPAGARDVALMLLESNGSDTNLYKLHVDMHAAGFKVSDYDIGIAEVYLDVDNYAQVAAKATLHGTWYNINTGSSFTTSHQYKFYNTATSYANISTFYNSPPTVPNVNGRSLYADVIYGKSYWQACCQTCYTTVCSRYLDMHGNSCITNLATSGTMCFASCLYASGGCIKVPIIEGRYSNANTTYRGGMCWNNMQLGNNGINTISAGNTSTGGSLDIRTNVTNDMLAQGTANGWHVARFCSDGTAKFYYQSAEKLETYTNGIKVCANSHSTCIYPSAAWSHFYSTASKYYFDHEIRVNSGVVSSYDEPLKLATCGTVRAQVCETCFILSNSIPLVVNHGGDITPTSGGVGQIKVNGNGYSTYIAMDGSNLNFGHNSSARGLALQTNESTRLCISGDGTSTTITSATVTGNGVICAAGTSGYTLRTAGCIYANNDIVASSGVYGSIVCGTSCVSSNSLVISPIVCATSCLTTPSCLKFTASTPTIATGGAYIIVPGGIYVNGGTFYAENTTMHRNGICDDTGAVLNLIGGNDSGKCTKACTFHSHTAIISCCLKVCGGGCWCGRPSFNANNTNNWDTIATANGSQGAFEVYNNGSGNDAFFAFHAGGDYATYFGLDADSNRIATGGWSAGAVKYPLVCDGGSSNMTICNSTRIMTLSKDQLYFNTLGGTPGFLGGDPKICMRVMNSAGSADVGYTKFITDSAGVFTISVNSSSSTCNRICITTGGAVTIPGSLSKGSGSFLIPHPDPEKEATMNLSHSFVESPTGGDNIYRWEVNTQNCRTVIELPSYYKHLNKDDMVWASPSRHFGSAYGEVTPDQCCVVICSNKDGAYNILLIGTRKDKYVTHWKGVETENTIVRDK